MSLPLIITPEAEEDLAEARTWYERKREGLGDEFVLCVEEALDRIRRLPESATEVYPGVRRVVIRRFPYGVFYRVDPDQIAVIAFITAGAIRGGGKHGPDNVKTAKFHRNPTVGYFHPPTQTALGRPRSASSSSGSWQCKRDIAEWTRINRQDCCSS